MNTEFSDRHQAIVMRLAGQSAEQICHALAQEFRMCMTELTGLPPLSPDSPEWYKQMVAVPLPDCDIDPVKRCLYEEYRIEIPLVKWNGVPLIRASFQAYNTQQDVEHAVSALSALGTDARPRRVRV